MGRSNKAAPLIEVKTDDAGLWCPAPGPHHFSLPPESTIKEQTRPAPEERNTQND
jgi:hypothetical protein